MNDAAQQAPAEQCRLAALVYQALAVLHDVNTPLGVSITAVTHFRDMHRDFADLASSGKLKKSDLEKFLGMIGEVAGIIEHNLERAIELTRGFQQVAVDQVRLQRSVFNVKRYIEKTLLCFQPELKKHSCEVRLTGSDNIEIDSLPGAFAQIISNFLANSLKHAYDPGDKGVIDIEIKREGKTLMLLYRDNGKGLCQEEKDKMFDVFYSSKMGEKSSGLGLFIVHDAVTRLLGGAIECFSEEGKGLAFEIHMPIE
jgi:signal transduction histidine kinase